MNDTQAPRRMPARRVLAAIAGAVLIVAPACDGESETRLDPQQERNIQPGQREEGTPRSEEN